MKGPTRSCGSSLASRSVRASGAPNGRKCSCSLERDDHAHHPRNHPAALHALLQTQPAPVLRGEVLPERVPAAGLLILRDGDPGEPAVTLSPLRYHYQHRAEVEAVVQAGTGRDAAFDALAAGVGTALSADRTLGGLCDWVEAEAPRPVDLAVDGAATLKAAVIPVVLHYASADPLG